MIPSVKPNTYKQGNNCVDFTSSNSNLQTPMPRKYTGKIFKIITDYKPTSKDKSKIEIKSTEFNEQNLINNTENKEKDIKIETLTPINHCEADKECSKALVQKPSDIEVKNIEHPIERKSVV